jgi:hypothetical protein
VGGTCVLILGGLNIAEMLYADLATISFTSYGLRKKFDLVGTNCRIWNLRCNLYKRKIIIFKKEWKLETSER